MRLAGSLRASADRLVTVGDALAYRPAAGRTRTRTDALAVALPLALAAAACGVYLALQVHPVDLAASVYRERLFSRIGFSLWDGGWYAGHYTLSYSVLAPPLSALIGSVALEIVAALTSATLFQAVARHRFGRAAWFGSAWFGLSAARLVFHGQVPFALGVTIGLAAVLALQRRRTALAVALALLCPLASPVAGLFLGLAAVAVALAHRRRDGFAVAVAAVVPTLALELVFPEGGRQVYRWSDLAWLLASVAIVLVLMPRRERAIRLGAWLYGALGLAAFALHSPLGNNVGRLAPLVAAPLVACAVAVEGRWRERALTTFALLALLGYFQWRPAVDDTNKALSDPATRAAYYRPLLAQLGPPDERAPARVEVPFTQAHWEAAEIPPRHPLARGWMRQLDYERAGIFYGGVINRVTYATWLAEHAVGYVAVASGKPDSSSYKERALIEGGLPYLRLVWQSRDWRLYRVTLPHAMVVPEAGASMRLRSVRNDSLTIDVIKPGAAAVKVRWSPYWRATGACVERDGEWIRLLARRPGRVRMAIDFAPGRVFSHGRRCG